MNNLFYRFYYICMDARDPLRSRVSFGLDPLACWSGIAGWTAGCGQHARTLTASSRLRATTYTMGCAVRAGQSRRDLRLRAATFVCDPATPDTTFDAPTCVQGWYRRSDDDRKRLRLPPSPPTAPRAAGDGAAWRASLCCMWGFYSIYPHTLSGRRQALLTSQWSCAACLAALGVPDRRTISPLTASGTFSGAGLACATVGRSPSAPCTLRGLVPVCPARLCVVRGAGTVVLDRQRRAAATVAGTPGRAQLVSRQQHPGGVA
jgi:hypothetical protein